MVSGITTSEAVKGAHGLVGYVLPPTMLSGKSYISLSASESFGPIRGVKSLATILNGLSLLRRCRVEYNDFSGSFSFSLVVLIVFNLLVLLIFPLVIIHIPWNVADSGLVTPSLIFQAL